MVVRVGVVGVVAGAFEVHGGILAKYQSLGTVGSLLQFPTTDERGCPDGVGRYNHFQGGSIYWTRATGAHEVHGAIRAKWASLGWERGFLRYPLSDETAVTGGRASQFQGGNIYWSAATGARGARGDPGRLPAARRVREPPWAAGQRRVQHQHRAAE